MGTAWGQIFTIDIWLHTFVNNKDLTPFVRHRRSNEKII